MRARTLLVAVPLTVLAACSRPAADPSADLPPPNDLMIGTGFDDATPVASDLEVHRPAPAGEATPRPAPTPPPLAEAAPVTALPAPQAAEARPEAVAPGAVDGEAVLAAGAEADSGEALDMGSGKPRPSLNEGPIRDPGRGVVLVRGGVGGVHDDCKIGPPIGVDPPLIVARPDHARGALVNDRSPSGGSIDGTREPPNVMGAGHPGGTGTSMTGRPLPRGGGMGSRPAMPRGGRGGIR